MMECGPDLGRLSPDQLIQAQVARSQAHQMRPFDSNLCLIVFEYNFKNIQLDFSVKFNLTLP